MEKVEIARLYDAYAQDVFRLALSYLYHSQDAEDICHSVFLTLVEKDIPLFPGSEKAWLLKCAANLCKDQLKSFWRKSREELNENVVFTNERDREIWIIVGTLPPKYRAVVHLYYYEGYSIKEIAKIIKKSESAVKMRLTRGKDELKKEMEV